MIARPSAIRALLRSRAAGSQVSDAAVVALCAAVEAEAIRFADATLQSFEARNEARAIQRIPSLRRVTDEDVARAIGRLHGNL